MFYKYQPLGYFLMSDMLCFSTGHQKDKYRNIERHANLTHVVKQTNQIHTRRPIWQNKPRHFWHSEISNLLRFFKAKISDSFINNLSSGWFGGSSCNCCWKCVWVLHFNKKKKERKEGRDLWELWVPLLSLQLQFPLRRHTLKMCPLCLRPWTCRTWTCWTRTKRLEKWERGRWYRRACQAFGRTNCRGTLAANEHLIDKAFFQRNNY